MPSWRRHSHRARFVKTRNGAEVDAASLARSREFVGLKGYVANNDVGLMRAGEVIASNNGLCISSGPSGYRSDVAARPMFHHTREAIEAHLTIMFAALAIAR